MTGITSVRIRGFTILELLIAMALAAILLSLALPAFNGLVAQRDLTSRVNDLVLAMNYARSEAARTGGLVSVQAVDAADGDNEWGPGFCVVQGNPGNCNGVTLRTFDGYGDGTFDGATTFDGVTVVGFNSRGLMTVGSAGTLDLCNDDEDIDPGRIVTVSAIGRASVADLVCHP